jgi:hypothetical protein
MNACSQSHQIFEDLGWFDAVHEAMGEIEHLPTRHWAVAKMVAFAAQDGPFLHIDNDVLLNKPLPKKTLCSPVLVQCVEKWQDFKGNYGPQLEAVKARPEKPKWWQASWPITRGKAFAYNTGIMGGCDIGFIQDYARSGIDYMLQHGADLVDVNTTIEQAYLAMCAAAQGEPVTCLLTDWRNNRQARELGYVHYWGGTKRDRGTDGVLNLEKIARRLQHEYPHRYAQVMQFHHLFNKR